MPRGGGDRGGGPLPRRIDLSEPASLWLKQRATILGTRYRREEASAAANTIFEAVASGTVILLPVSADLFAAVPWLQEARAMCVSEEAQRGLDQLIAALWTAQQSTD